MFRGMTLQPLFSFITLSRCPFLRTHRPKTGAKFCKGMSQVVAIMAASRSGNVGR